MIEAVLYLHLALGIFLFAALLMGRLHAWRAGVLAAALLLVLSGGYNFMTRMAGAPKGWHALVGIKILLALHVIAMSVLLARGGADPANAVNVAKAERWRKGALISGSAVILIGLYLSNFAR